MKITITRSIITYRYPRSLRIIGYSTASRFNEQSTLIPDDKLSYGSMFSQIMDTHQIIEITELNQQQHPIFDHPIHIITLNLPPLGQSIGLTLKYCPYLTLHISGHPHQIHYAVMIYLLISITIFGYYLLKIMIRLPPFKLLKIFTTTNYMINRIHSIS